ncbi:MAG: extracellular solute-binding protein family 1 [Nocardioidaceae bacterium]|nr:extracellular solute-binding protein family 1 [Nocardioidaceae bacterium]
MNKTRLIATLATSAVAVAALAACGPPEKGGSASTSKAATATSAADIGGMSGLEKAANAEGKLNVIALPPNWANYGNVIKAFQKKYPKIKITSAQPDAASQDEVNAAKQLKGKSSAPDVFDLGQQVLLANTDLYAPYKVSTWADVPDTFKDASGAWINDYGGYMSIGYDSAKVDPVTSVDDLLKPAYKGKVALNGDPTQAGAAFSGVVMVALSQGGSADDVSKGVDFFAKLKKAGNFLPLDVTPSTIESGQTPVVIDWDYLNAAVAKTLPTWKTVVPGDQPVAGYYAQAISKDAPHPAAARLWEEFLYSDEGQNLWLGGGARPVRADAMVKAGTIDKTAYAALPPVNGTPVVVSQAQADKAATYLAANWAKATS